MSEFEMIFFYYNIKKILRIEVTNKQKKTNEHIMPKIFLYLTLFTRNSNQIYNGRTQKHNHKITMRRANKTNTDSL